MTTEEAMMGLYEMEMRPPAYEPAAEIAAEDPDTQGILDSAEGGTPMPNIPEMAAVWDAWTDAIDLVFNDELTAEEALEDAVEAILLALGYED